MERKFDHRIAPGWIAYKGFKTVNYGIGKKEILLKVVLISEYVGIPPKSGRAQDDDEGDRVRAQLPVICT